MAASPSLRMVSGPTPRSSAKATATRSTCSRLIGIRGSVAGLPGGTIRTMTTATPDRSTEPTPAPAGVETMKAIVQDEYGPAPEDVLRLAEVARPTIEDDEVLIRVRAASVDRGTWHVMAGLPYPIRVAGYGLRRPKASNPGRSVAGTVESVGKDVTEFKPGDDVYGTCDGSSPSTPAPKRDAWPPSRRTSPSSRRRPSPSPRSPRCRACGRRRRCRPGRRC
jgi:hypothetical protein